MGYNPNNYRRIRQEYETKYLNAREAAETRRPSHAAARIVRRILFAVLIVICGAVFWLTAVLIQPTPVETPQTQVTETAH